MAFIDQFLPEFDREMGTTRRLLERVPFPAEGYTPHEKSRTLSQLATHVARIPFMAVSALTQDGMDMMGRPPQDDFKDSASLLAGFDDIVKTARAAMVGKTDGELNAPWTLRAGSKEMFTVPKSHVLRVMCLNHLIHHRGQLSVYLRLQQVPLPSIYGPSADEAV
jgi:uncharacterized damage-inducible protein DinB